MVKRADALDYWWKAAVIKLGHKNTLCEGFIKICKYTSF